MYFKKLSVLKAAVYLQILFCVGIMVFNFESLTTEEGWGMIALIMLILINLFLLLVDFVLYKFIKNETTYNLVGAAILIGYAVVFQPWGAFL